MANNSFQKVKDFLKLYDIDMALVKLEEIVNVSYVQYQNEFLLIESQYNGIKENEYKGFLTTEESNTKKQKLISRILNFISKLEKVQEISHTRKTNFFDNLITTIDFYNMIIWIIVGIVVSILVFIIRNL